MLVREGEGGDVQHLTDVDDEGVRYRLYGDPDAVPSLDLQPSDTILRQEREPSTILVRSDAQTSPTRSLLHSRVSHDFHPRIIRRRFGCRAAEERSEELRMRSERVGEEGEEVLGDGGAVRAVGC